MISAITLLALDKVNVSSIQISTLHIFCSPYLFPRWSLQEIVLSEVLLKINCLLKAIKLTGSPNAYLQK